MRASRLSGRGPYLAAAATVLAAAARFSPSPVLVDAATGLAAEGARLEYPFWHVALTPFATLGDLAACASRGQILALVAFVAVLVAAARRAGGAGRADLLDSCGYLLLSLAVLAWGALWPRDPARLVVADPALMPVDFHSHTSASWDGRSWFTPQANLDWHTRAGFGAVFVTDHNRLDAARLARRLSATAWEAGQREGAHGLEGEELSLHDAHVLLLAPTRHAEPAAYPGLEGLRRFLGDAGPVFGGAAVMSLPEYHRHHSERLSDLADWGARGFEIVSASPKALSVPADFRRRVVALCRERGLFMTGGSDNHGYGSTSCVWTLVRLPGWRSLDPLARERGVMAALAEGFSSTRVIVRARALDQPADARQAVLDAPRAVWAAVGAWTPAQLACALLWLWLPVLWRRRREQ